MKERCGAPLLGLARSTYPTRPKAELAKSGDIPQDWAGQLLIIIQQIPIDYHFQNEKKLWFYDENTKS